MARFAASPRRRAELVSATACVLWVLAAALTVLPIAAAGQQIYKCKGKNGVIEYSASACPGEVMNVIRPDGAPSEADRRRAVARVNAETERYRAQEEGAARLRAANKAADMQLFDGSPKTSPKDDSANDRMITPGRTGWDVKARGQVAAEDVAKQRAREAANGVASSPVAQDRAAPRAAWENEKVLTHDKSGWSQTTRSAAVSAEGEKEYKRERARIEAAAAAKAAATARHRLDQEEEERKRRFLGRRDAGSCSDGKGNEYRKAVGSLNDYNSSDGRRCTRHGNMMSCF